MFISRPCMFYCMGEIPHTPVGRINKVYVIILLNILSLQDGNVTTIQRIVAFSRTSHNKD